MGGWNKGIKNSTGTAFKGKKHSADTVDKLKSRPKEVYKKPKAEEIITSEICEYGCCQTAKYKFANGKIFSDFFHANANRLPSQETAGSRITPPGS